VAFFTNKYKRMVRKKIVGLLSIVLIFMVGFVWNTGDVLACQCQWDDCSTYILPDGGWSQSCDCGTCIVVCSPGTYVCNDGCCSVCIPSWGPCSGCEGSMSDGCGGSQACGGACCVPSWQACVPSAGPGTQVDGCGGSQSCCTASNPSAPGLVGPANLINLDGLTTTLSWSAASFGYGCPNTNRYLVYASTSSNPTTLVASLGSASRSYEYTGASNRRIYWKVVASNGSRSASSSVRSFYTAGLVTGTLFDASEIDSCALMGVVPKVSGGVVDIIGGASYAPTSDALGVYSQYVLTPDSYALSTDPGVDFILPPKLFCQGTTADFVSDGTIATRDFGFWRIYGGWWQVIGGDVYGGGGVESVIPVTLLAEDKFLVKQDSGGFDGLVFYGSGGEVDLGTAPGVSVSNSGWEAESGYLGQDINYEYYMAKMRTLDKTDWGGSGKPAYVPVEGYEIYTYTGDAVVDFGVSGGEKMVIMVDGNVLVDSDVTVEAGSHLTVIVSGDITFANNVGEVHGWWVADRMVIESTGDEATDIQFRGEGSFVGWDSIEFGRDRGITNNSEPSEEFTYRPDLMVNAPTALKFSRYKWLEQVP
jgi:hypothetical protein